MFCNCALKHYLSDFGNLRLVQIHNRIDSDEVSQHFITRSFEESVLSALTMSVENSLASGIDFLDKLDGPQAYLPGFPIQVADGLTIGSLSIHVKDFVRTTTLPSRHGQVVGCLCEQGALFVLLRLLTCVRDFSPSSILFHDTSLRCARPRCWRNAALGTGQRLVQSSSDVKKTVLSLAPLGLLSSNR